MPNCSHSSLTVNRALCANTTNRMISSIGVTLLQDIMLGSVTHHPGLSVTYHSGSHHRTGSPEGARRVGNSAGDSSNAILNLNVDMTLSRTDAFTRSTKANKIVLTNI